MIKSLKLRAFLLLLSSCVGAGLAAFSSVRGMATAFQTTAAALERAADERARVDRQFIQHFETLTHSLEAIGTRLDHIEERASNPKRDDASKPRGQKAEDAAP